MDDVLDDSLDGARILEQPFENVCINRDVCLQYAERTRPSLYLRPISDPFRLLQQLTNAQDSNGRGH